MRQTLNLRITTSDPQFRYHCRGIMSNVPRSDEIGEEDDQKEAGRDESAAQGDAVTNNGAKEVELQDMEVSKTTASTYGRGTAARLRKL